MSRIGKQPIEVPADVEVKIESSKVTVKGPKGELVQDVSPLMKITQEDNQIIVERPNDEKESRSFHGLTRTLIFNMIEGVTKGFTKELELHGVGYRAFLKGKSLELSIGYSHPTVIEPPEGITFEVPESNKIIVSGFDKQLVGEITAKIRAQRPPEPYKGKGIRYKGEHVRRKLGKAAATA